MTEGGRKLRAVSSSRGRSEKRLSPEFFLQTSSAVATGIGFFVTMLMAAGAQAQLGPDADTFGGSAFPIRSFPADNIFALSLLHYATS